MSTEFEESKLTSYALGELDENERAEIEALVWRDESARRYVEEVRAMGKLLQDEMAKEPLPEVTTTPASKVPMKLVPPMRLNRSTRSAWRIRLALAAAACVVLGGITYSIVMPKLNRAREVATAKPQVRIEDEFASSHAVNPMPSQVAAPAPLAQPATGSTIPIASDHAAKVWGSKTLKSDLSLNAAPAAATPRPGPRPGIDMAGGTSLMYEVPVAAVSATPAPAASVAPGASSLQTEGTLSIAGSKVTSNSVLYSSAAPVDNLTVYRGAVPQQQIVTGNATDAYRVLPNNDEDELLLREKPLERDPNAAAAEQLERHFNTEAYDRIHDNPFLNAMQNPLSTFSIDVDTASYSNVRRFLQSGQKPPKDAVRIEEMLNYFPYDYAPPGKGAEDPFATHVEIAECPWNHEHRLVRVGLKGKEIAADKRPASNLVFLIDVSGSMNEPNKLPLVKSALRMLTEQLGGEDRVAMVVYAGNAGLVLPSTSCRDGEKQSILNALDNLEAGGSTNGAQGIELAYKVAQEHFIKGGVNRVILCTDGDFNVGVTNQGDLTRMIEDKAKGGVFLSVMGFGYGNLKDSTMEKLADKGNGNYGYIDTPQEARKEFVEEISSTLVTIAKDVKIQIEFNPAVVSSYRLIGYENRLLAKEDFNNDKKDAGEIGAGHAVTALYEVVPAGGEQQADGKGAVDELHFQKPAAVVDGDRDHTGDMLILKLRYKQPEADKSSLIEITVKDEGKSFAKASDDFKFGSAVAAFGMILRDSPHKGSANFGAVEEWAGDGMGKDTSGYRKEFLELVKKAGALR